VVCYGLDGRCSIPGRDAKICFVTTESRTALEATQFIIQWVKWPESQTVQLSPSGGGGDSNFVSTSPMRLHGGVFIYKSNSTVHMSKMQCKTSRLAGRSGLVSGSTFQRDVECCSVTVRPTRPSL
jgi:hypothetical protein